MMRTQSDKIVIRLEGVTRIYKIGVERIHALDGVDLELRENEYVAVMGPSGSGKSTLMNVLGCLDRVSGGRYELDGQNTTGMGDAALARVRKDAELLADRVGEDEWLAVYREVTVRKVHSS
jgi:putative ABC transport system ATP-binding protein